MLICLATKSGNWILLTRQRMFSKKALICEPGGLL